MNRWKIVIWAITTLVKNDRPNKICPVIPKSNDKYEINTIHMPMTTGIWQMANFLFSFHKNNGVELEIKR